ncbi:MAG: hypothetical protein M1835_005688, partial [Candelina submexicana]
MEEVSVYTTKESFERLAVIAEHPILRTQVLTAVCLVSFLYETFTKRNACDQRVKQRSELCFMPIRRRRAFDVTAESSTSADTLLEETMDNHHNAAMLAYEALKADPDQAYADYDRYYSEQEEILQHEFVTQLSTALAAFPRLHTVEVALPENAAVSLKPQQFKHILYNVGMQCPNHSLHGIGTQ